MSFYVYMPRHAGNWAERSRIEDRLSHMAMLSQKKKGKGSEEKGRVEKRREGKGKEEKEREKERGEWNGGGEESSCLDLTSHSLFS